MKKQLLLLVMILLSMVASAQQVEIDGIYYYCEWGEEQAEVIGPSSKECTGEIIIPGTIVDQGVTFDVTSIREQAFMYCSGLTSVIIGSNVTNIGEYAFDGCSNLSSITIPSSVTYIGNYAFHRSSSQSSLFIPKSVTYIGEGAFSYWPNLTSIEVDAENPRYDSRDNCNAVIETETNSLIVGCKYSTIPYSITRIGNYAFAGSGLSYVGSPFYSAIPSNITSIGQGAFANTGITVLEIPNSVTEIEQDTFVGCTDLERVYLPNNMTSIGIGAFEGCSNLTGIDIPSSVTSIGNAAFGYSGITYFTIPDGVSTIGYGTFFYCPNLASITIPSNVTSIDNFAFFECPNLSNIVVESGNPKYDSRDNCNAIIETETNSLIVGGINSTIPNSITSIGTNAFSGRNLSSFIIPSSVTSIGYQSFYNSSITSIVIQNGVTSIEDYAFKKCQGLTSITIPSSVTRIKGAAFEECSALTMVTIGSGIESIGSQAFASCPKLKDVYCYAVNVPNTNTNAFNYSHIESTALHVPAASVDAYKAAEPWKNFGSFEKTPKCAKPSIAIKDGKLTFSCETEGVEFVSHFSIAAGADNNTSEVEIPTTYIVSVYASKDGYEDSDVVTETINIIKGDIDGDGEVDIADAVRIVNFIVGKIPALAPRNENNVPSPE